MKTLTLTTAQAILLANVLDALDEDTTFDDELNMNVSRVYNINDEEMETLLTIARTLLP